MPTEIKDIAKERTAWFQENIHDPRLHTHKLGGSLEGFLSFSLTGKYRIMFEFEKNGDVVFRSIGDHEIYDSKI